MLNDIAHLSVCQLVCAPAYGKSCRTSQGFWSQRISANWACVRVFLERHVGICERDKIDDPGYDSIVGSLVHLDRRCKEDHLELHQ